MQQTIAILAFLAAILFISFANNDAGFFVGGLIGMIFGGMACANGQSAGAEK